MAGDPIYVDVNPDDPQVEVGKLERPTFIGAASPCFLKAGQAISKNRAVPICPPLPQVTTVESMCMYCHKNGKTCILLTKIPFFKGTFLYFLYTVYCIIQFIVAMKNKTRNDSDEF